MADMDITRITPFLTVRDGKEAVDFYLAAFKGVEKKRYEMPGGKMTSVLQIAGAEFYIGDEEPECGNLAPDGKVPNPVRIILQTSQADQLYDQAVKLGSTPICPMTTEAYWRIGKLRDPFGHVWEIGYPLIS